MGDFFISENMRHVAVTDFRDSRDVCRDSGLHKVFGKTAYRSYRVGNRAVSAMKCLDPSIDGIFGNGM